MENIKIVEVKLIERRRPRIQSYIFHSNDRARLGQRAYNARMREHASTTRVYVWPRGETVMENIINRRNRPHEAYRPPRSARAPRCWLHREDQVESVRRVQDVSVQPGIRAGSAAGRTRRAHRRSHHSGVNFKQGTSTSNRGKFEP